MKKILAIDREGINRVIIKMLLEAMGHTVTEAMTCAEGIHMLEREKFDLVITDLRTSDVSGDATGFDVIQKVRRDCGSTRVILATSTLTEEDGKLGFVYPPDAFLQKPFDQGYFRAVVGTTLVD